MATLSSVWRFPEDRGLSRPEAVSTTPYVQRDVRVGGVRLRYVDEPVRGAARSEALPVLILPGHTARIEDYDPLVAPLAATRRVLLPDLPGKGYAEKPLRRYDYGYYEESAAGFLDAVGVPRVDVVGGSLGCALALRLAHRYPERVRRVLGWAPGNLAAPRPGVARAMRAAGRIAPIVWLSLWIQSRFWYAPTYPQRDEELRRKFVHFREVMCPGFAAMYSGMAADSVGTSLQPLAPGIAQPVLLLVGSLDEGGGVQAGLRRLLPRLPNAELRTVPGAGHSLVSEAFDTLVAAILEFFDAANPLRRAS